MDRLHDVISALLEDLHVGAPFRAIHAGEVVPLLTDYSVRRIPEEWNAPVPPDIVDGRSLTPLFVGCDSNAVYCVDNDSHEIVEIDPEDPWPPTNLYSDWEAFVAGLYSIMSEDKPEAEKTALRDLLQLKS